MALYLADSSIWAWARHEERPDIRAKLADRFERDQVATCAPVILEAMHRDRTGADYERIHRQLFAPLDLVPIAEEVGARAVAVQRGLAKGTHGNHLRPAVDYLIAAIAELADPRPTLWFFDRDLQVICEHTGQPFEAESAARCDRETRAPAP